MQPGKEGLARISMGSLDNICQNQNDWMMLLVAKLSPSWNALITGLENSLSLLHMNCFSKRILYELLHLRLEFHMFYFLFYVNY